jgi:NADH-quinone oxidoreductase subunit L
MVLSLVLIILLFPLAGFLVNGLGYRAIPGKTAGIISGIAVLVPFTIGLGLLFSFTGGTPLPGMIDIGRWISVGSLQVPFSLMIDSLSLTMILIITGVGFLIHVYSIGYMHGDERMTTFFAQLSLFTFMMLILVMSSNYLFMFVGWEGVGLCSYLLIGFWYKKKNFSTAARKAFIMNRIGDLGFLLGIILMYFTFGSSGFTSVFGQAGRFQSGDATITLITLLLLVGALGKSAQIPLFTWLPDAMAGPTPVSALIHAATMVTAGVYMIARSSVLFTLAPLTMSVILVIGTLTALFAATIGLFQNDIKKVLAYSTVSQLGYMFMALGLGAFSTAIFHVTTHAFFKALLFLGAGSVIHALAGEQDIRKMGGLNKKLPFTYFTFLIGTLAISGIPPFSGFFSKDEILAAAFSYNPLVWLLGLAGAMMTAFYMFRLFYLVFHNDFRGGANIHLHESPAVMTWPLIVLAALSLFGGLINIPGLFGGNTALADFLHSSVTDAAVTETSHGTEWMLVISSLIILVLCIAAAWNYYTRLKKVPSGDEAERGFINSLVYHKYYIDEAYDFLFVKPYEWLSVKLHRSVDTGLIDRMVNGIGSLALFINRKVKAVQTGNISLYLFYMVIGLILVILALFWN